MNIYLALACIVVALGAGLLWGFALASGIKIAKHPMFHGSYEDSMRRAQFDWARHWATEREARENAAAQAEMANMRMSGDAAFARANARFSIPLDPANGMPLHIHIEH